MPLDQLLPYADRDRELASLTDGETQMAYVSKQFTPYAIAALIHALDQSKPCLVIAPDDQSARDLANGIATFLPNHAVRHYPARGVLYESHLAPPPHLVGMRIAALDAMAGLEAPGGGGHQNQDEKIEHSVAARGTALPAVMVASIGALAEKVPDPELRPKGFVLNRGDLLDLDEAAGQLVACGYQRVDVVQERGQFSIRGDILDIFSATEDHPARVELFDIEIESIRHFSTFTQRSLETADRVEIAPAAELDLQHREAALLATAGGPPAAGERLDISELLPVDRFRPVLELLPDELLTVVVGDDEIGGALEELWSDVEASLHDDHALDFYTAPEDLVESINDRLPVRISNLDSSRVPALRAEQLLSRARTAEAAEAEIEKLVRSGYRTVVVWQRQGEAERATYNFARVRPQALDALDATTQSDEGWPGVFFTVGNLRDGFVSPALKLAVVPDRELIRRASKSPDALPTRGKIASFSDLALGDIIVHEDHGIARFVGFENKAVAGITRDYLSLEYRGGDKVFLPAEQLHKVSRYFGAAGVDGGIALSKLGGKTWENIKSRARKAAHELAGELINLYAERRVQKGHAFAPDSEWQHDFEAAFPYRETSDQLDAIEQVKTDMESTRPMDRLICGDVGYGKTEVAIRAAFKAVQDGKQVMVLAPTTILTQQHFGTFSERLRDYPVRVDFASRFRTAAEQKQVMKEFAAGQVDILIGTHRLISPDVQPKDLGLIIVDEEQRFGVKQKELLRQMRMRVDVISLSATPIPRTMQMALSGMRDISVIETPPEGRRPVRTHVGEYDEEIVKQALEREQARGGQSLFLHDRVDSIDQMAENLRALCPTLSFEVVHGQLDEKDLEQRMLSFIRGGSDCLVCTTIVESGLDIPAANTLVVERADKLGLAQAYQIRGRVGRGRERAFAYFLYPGAAGLTELAASRLATLSDYTELGSGFKVAMRDLEIRGAGDLLGDEQSGHVAAIGFDLYISMIEAAVAELSGRDLGDEIKTVRLDVSVDAYVPGNYVLYEQAKIELHRRVSGAREIADLVLLREELKDRFGPVPEPLDNLIKLQDARIKLGRAGARSVTFKAGRLSITPIQLDSTRLRELREEVDGVVFEAAANTVTLRVEDDGPARLDALVALSESLLKHALTD